MPAGEGQPDTDIDDATAAEVPAEELLLGMRQLAVRARKAKLKISRRVASQNNMNDRKMLLHIFCVCRGVCGPAQHFHETFNASRVGGVGRLWGYMTSESLAGCWAPPQTIYCENTLPKGIFEHVVREGGDG